MTFDAVQALDLTNPWSLIERTSITAQEGTAFGRRLTEQVERHLPD